jgi:putative tryptophan/tyrosine transport system substrate-binding protein
MLRRSEVTARRGNCLARQFAGAWALSAAWAWASPAAAAGTRPQVAVVTSSDLPAYEKVRSGFSRECKGEVVDYELKGSEERADKEFAKIRENPPALVLAIGPIAANAARRALSSVPIVFVMVPNYEKYGLEAKNVTGISLTLPPRFQLSALHSVVAQVKRVGVVYNPAFSQTVVDASTVDAETAGLSLFPVKVESAGGVGRALKSLVGKVDALWMIADRTVADAAVVKQMIDFSAKQHLPLMALSEGQVKDGALVSFSPSPSAIGGQAGRLANRIVFEKIDPGAMAVQQPEDVDMAVNLATAKSLTNQCDFAVDVLRFASQKGWTVRVYE